MHRFDPFRPDPRPHMVPRLGRHVATSPVTVLAYVDRYVPMVNAGAEWMLHAMLQDSARRGHRVIVATPCTNRPRVVDGVEVYPVREGLAAAADAEVVVGHLLYTRQVIAHARAAQLPLLYLVHNSDQLAAWGIRRDDVSALVWNSEWIGAEARYLRDVRRVPATIVRPPLDVDRYAVGTERETVTLVNPIPAKGAAVFYALASRFPGAKFLAVEGAYGAQQRPQRQHGNVEWHPQTSEIARDVYSRTRVLLMPSTYESWGRVACEALCSGIPVIAAPTPGLREALAGAATFVDPEDIDGWADALRALDDPTRYAEAAGAALDRAAELGDLARVDLDRWDRLVRLAAGGTRVRSGSMETTPADRYDPFRGHKADPTTAAAEPPEAEHEAPVGAQEPEAAIPPDGATEPAGAQEDAQEAPETADPWEVPAKAVDIVHALGTVLDPEVARARAEMVQAAELARPEGDRRKSVLAAADKILG